MKLEISPGEIEAMTQKAKSLAHKKHKVRRSGKHPLTANHRTSTPAPPAPPRPPSADLIEARFKITPEKIAKLIFDEFGLLTPVARKTGIPLTTLQRYVKDRPLCQDAVYAAKEAMGDTAERKLYNRIKRGDIRCLLYYLSTVHASRGYGLGKAQLQGDPQPMQIGSINIIAVPPGHFLPADDKPTIEHQ